MGYKSLIRNQVRKAFIAAKDLVVDATLTQNAATAFNFGTSTAIMGTPVVKTVKAIVTEKKRKADVGVVVFTEIMLNAEDVSDPTIYDTIVIEGVTHNVVTPYVNNGFTITAEIAKNG